MIRFKLRQVINHKNKSLLYLGMTVIFLTMYLLSGAISYKTGIVLPIHPLERGIPFLTWSIWIYIVLYPIYIVWSLYSYKDTHYMNKTFYYFILLTFISCALFILIPVTYPRELFPLPAQSDLSTLLFKQMRAVDKPSNCFPSLHVGLCYLFSFGFRYENKRNFWIALFISTLVALSTLTTKQHYSYDLIAGFLLAYGLHELIERSTIKA